MEMRLEDYIYNLGLNSALQNEDIEYLARCEKNRAAEGELLMAEIASILERINLLKENQNREISGYFSAAANAAELIKRYNDGVAGCSNSFFAPVMNMEEKKKYLKKYYSLAGALSELYERLFLMDFCASHISELVSKSVLLEKKAYLYGLVCNFLLADMDLSEMEKNLCLVKAILDEIAETAAKLYEIAETNSKLFRDYLVSLEKAVDAKNKGKKMNISAIKKCNLMFVNTFKTTL